MVVSVDEWDAKRLLSASYRRRQERPPARSGTAPPDPRTDLRTCSPAGLRDYYTFARHVDQYLCSYSELGAPLALG